MRTLRFLIPVILVIGAGVSTAQIDPNLDGIGIYSDTGAMVNQIELEVGVPQEIYLALTRPSSPTMFRGFECSVVGPEHVSIWGYNCPYPKTFALFNPPEFTAGWADPVLLQNVNIMMSFIIMPLDSAPAQFFIGGATQDYPMYVDDNYNTWEMTPYPFGLEAPSFAVNGPLPDEATSWGEVKALFRD